MSSREELELAVKAAEAALAAAQLALYQFDTSIENNVYSSLEEAEGEIEDKLLQEAFEDCQGAYNCGAPEYTQLFMVDGKKYLATLTVEYNRHDKTYYYIDGSDFQITEVVE